MLSPVHQALFDAMYTPSRRRTRDAAPPARLPARRRHTVVIAAA